MKYVEKQTVAVTRSWNIMPAMVIGLAIGVGSSASAPAQTTPKSPPAPTKAQPSKPDGALIGTGML